MMLLFHLFILPKIISGNIFSLISLIHIHQYKLFSWVMFSWKQLADSHHTLFIYNWKVLTKHRSPPSSFCKSQHHYCSGFMHILPSLQQDCFKAPSFFPIKQKKKKKKDTFYDMTVHPAIYEVVQHFLIYVRILFSR